MGSERRVWVGIHVSVRVFVVGVAWSGLWRGALWVRALSGCGLTGGWVQLHVLMEALLCVDQD